jgi:hypothetical protein
LHIAYTFELSTAPNQLLFNFLGGRHGQFAAFHPMKAL